MIILTRLGGHALAVNPDLIERAEVTPDTVITLTDGHKIVVAEALDEVVRRVRTWRAGIAAEAYRLVADAERAELRDDEDGDSDQEPGDVPDEAFSQAFTHAHAHRAHAHVAPDAPATGTADRAERLTLVSGLGARLSARVLPLSRKED